MYKIYCLYTYTSYIHTYIHTYNIIGILQGEEKSLSNISEEKSKVLLHEDIESLRWKNLRYLIYDHDARKDNHIQSHKHCSRVVNRCRFADTESTNYTENNNRG